MFCIAAVFSLRENGVSISRYVFLLDLWCFDGLTAGGLRAWNVKVYRKDCKCSGGQLPLLHRLAEPSSNGVASAERGCSSIVERRLKVTMSRALPVR